MDRDAFRKELVKVALAEVGVRESGENSGERVRLYQAATWLSPGSWKWCAAFVCWCIAKAWKARPDRDPGFPFPNTPRAAEFEPWGVKHFALIRFPKVVIAGDIVIYKFAGGFHIGIAASDSSENTVDVVEGNTDGSGGRDGDGVYVRRRSLSSVRSVVAWNRAKKV